MLILLTLNKPVSVEESGLKISFEDVLLRDVNSCVTLLDSSYFKLFKLTQVNQLLHSLLTLPPWKH